MDLLLFEDAAVEYKARRAPKVSRKVHDPDSLMFWEPGEERIAAVMAFHGIADRDAAITFAQAMRAEILAMPLKQEHKWGPKRRDAMAAIEAANDALRERQAELAAMEKENTHGLEDYDGDCFYQGLPPVDDGCGDGDAAGGIHLPELPERAA